MDKLEEARRLQETYFPDEAKKKHTLPELIDRYIEKVLSFRPKKDENVKYDTPIEG